MTERDHLLAALMKEVLGPQSGPHEVLPRARDPRNEYITGVLTPREAMEQPDIEADADLLEEEGETWGEEDLEDPSIMTAPVVSFSPALNPKGLPHSMGLSFVVEGRGRPPAVEVCATWARYDHSPSSSDWQREPMYFLTGLTPVDNNRTWSAGPGVALHLRTRQLASTSQYRISLYLVNTTQPRDRKSIATEELLFQSQLRVHCPEGTVVVPLPGGLAGSLMGDGEQLREDESLGLLYRMRRPMARGHLCGALWNDIDPERPHPTLTLPADPPYSWTDAASVPAHERSKFSPADVRTEFVPCYPIETPDMNWRLG